MRRVYWGSRKICNEGLFSWFEERWGSRFTELVRKKEKEVLKKRGTVDA